MTNGPDQSARIPRRKFLQLSAAGVGAAGSVGLVSPAVASNEPSARTSRGRGRERRPTRPYNGLYTGENLTRIGFPMGGIGAGMICLEGTGALSHVSF